MMPKIQKIEYPTQEVNSEEAKTLFAENDWHNKVAIPNPKVQGDAKKAPVKETTPVTE